MPKRTGRVASIASAAVLIALTLTVFFLLRNFGPESAIRRLHHAVSVDDVQEVARVTLPSTKDNLKFIINLLKELSKDDPSIRLGRVDRKPDQVLEEVQYLLGNRYYTVIWVVDRKPAGWLVNIDATAELAQATLGL